MLAILSATLMCLWLFPLIAVSFVLMECLAALGESRLMPPARSLEGVLALIPAHNEEATLARCLASLLEDGLRADQIVVVANDCTDGTIKVAESFGVQVIAYHDLRLRPKARGLAYAINQLANQRVELPRVVMFFDADSWVAPGTVSALAGAVDASGYPAQGVFLQAAASPTLTSQLSAFAFMLKNLIRPLGLHHLGLPCLLYGSGMAFPGGMIDASLIDDEHETEDYHLAVRLARRGQKIVFCPDARISSVMKSGRQAASHQRSRWEQGHLRLLIRHTVPLLILGIRRRQIGLIAFALEIAIPPLALLVQLMGLLLLLSIVSALVGQPLPLTIALITHGSLAAAIVTAWLGFGQKDYPLHIFASAPVYIMSKSSAYARVILGEAQKIGRRIADG